ncbi:MAG: Ni/Fe hydrogenase subunit alpha [Candidatus Zixiibacteriota bacterium]
MKNKTIKVDYLARVEGEGGLFISLKNGKVVESKFNVFEPPRFFEGFLKNRKFTEAPDITARICGICPVAYQMSSSHAMEQICGVKVDGPLRDLRRLLYCGEWIESHALHIFMLHAPDFLGYDDAIKMAKDHPDIVKRALKLKKIGNDLMIKLGGREIHPINVRVGGFYKVPTRKDLGSFLAPLKWALEFSHETVEIVSGFEFPNLERDYEFVSLRHSDEYPICEGDIVSNKGIDIPIDKFLDFFEEYQVKHSTSLHARIKERGDYLVGPMARFHNNFDMLPSSAREAAKKAGLDKSCLNPYKSIIVRAIELIFVCEEAIKLIKRYEPPEKSCIECVPIEGVGQGCTEAPRGILYHRYKIDKDGIIQEARIIPPTSQNQKSIENDLRQSVDNNLHLSDEKITWLCEQTIRNYDPCISCSCHFLKLKISRD